ncbi:MAG: tetratricopeptide repeat protein [Candidatus Hydrogenedentes bacterium]|nr:tetratricopeptide repeat protein [Candidatus Hydrogenedentota bacterium]
MPVSTSVHISHCLQYIISLNPRSVLDVGCGFGLWGFLCREYLDVMEERVQPKDWKIRIDGLELFEPYIQAHQRALYSSIQIGDIRKLAPGIGNYELIIAGDVIEHLDKHEGEAIIEQLYEKATRALLVNIPLGEGWEHPERHGNPGELHRSQWVPEDFLPYPNIFQKFSLPAGDYGSFFCPKDCTVEQRVDGLLSAAEHKRGLGDIESALRHLRQASELAPADHSIILYLTDTLLNAGKHDEGAVMLQKFLERDPAFHYGYLVLAKMLRALRRNDEALGTLQRLLARPGLTGEERAQAEQMLAR